MDEVIKAQIEYIKDCLNLMNDGNYKELKGGALSTIVRLEKRLMLCGVGVPKGTLCGCGGTERVALDCTMKPCKHPKYYKG